MITRILPFLLTLLCASLAVADEPRAVENTAAKNVTAAEAEQLIEKKEVQILDVRTPEEFAKGRIKGAVNLDFNAADFQEKLTKLDKEKEYLVHCAVGGRSSRAGAKMKGLGFENVYNLEGGMEAWEAAGKKVEK